MLESFLEEVVFRMVVFRMYEVGQVFYLLGNGPCKDGRQATDVIEHR